MPKGKRKSDSNMLYFLSAVCVALLVAALSIGVLNQNFGFGQPSPSPTPTPKPTSVPNGNNLAPIPPATFWSTSTSQMQWAIGSSIAPNMCVYPVTKDGQTAIQMNRNDYYISQTGGSPCTRELDGVWTSIHVGDRIVYSAWFLTDPSSYVDNVVQAYRSGEVLGLDFYAAGRICEISTPTGLTSYPNYPSSMSQCHVAWGTSVWTKVTIDFIVQSSYEADPWGGYYTAGTMVTPIGFVPWIGDVNSNPSSQYATMWVYGTELYINP